MKIYGLQHLQNLPEVVAIDPGVGYTQGIIGLTQKPLIYLGSEPSGAGPPDAHAYKMAQ